MKYEKKKLFDLYQVLTSIDPNILEQILSRSRFITLKEGTLIFNELDSCKAFPFILSGIIRIFKQSDQGRELSLYHVSSGDVCVVTAGCLLGDEPYNASGMVKKDALLMMMDSGDFKKLLGVRPFREFIFSIVSKQILELTRLVEEVAFKKLDKRLAAELCSRGRKIQVTHQELADELGTVREMVTRILNDFAEKGCISSGRGWINILDETRLKRLAEA